MTELDPLSDDLRRLFDAEQRREDAPTAECDRVLLRLGLTLAAGVPIAQPAGPPPARSGIPATVLDRAARVRGVVRLARVAAIFLAGAASGVGGQRAVQHLHAKVGAPPARLAPDHPAPEVPPRTGPPPTELTPPVPSLALPSEPRAARAHRLPLPPSPPVASGADDHLGAERALLEIARAALVRGKAEGALAALARHEATFPRGELTEEREGLRVQALVAAGRYAAARARAAHFLRRYPRSLFSPVVTQALESIP